MNCFFLITFFCVLGGLFLGEWLMLGDFSGWLLLLLFPAILRSLFLFPNLWKYGLYFLLVIVLTALSYARSLWNPSFKATEGTLQGTLLQPSFFSSERQSFLLEGTFFSPSFQRKGKFWVSLSFPYPLPRGSLLQMRGRLFPLPEATNPHQRSWGRSLRRKGVVGIFRTPKDRGPHRLEVPVTWLSVLDQVRDQSMKGLGFMAEEEAQIFGALLLGHRGNWKSKIWRDFQKTGVLHFFAISGLHLALVFLFFWTLSASMGLSWRKSLLLAFLFLTLYLPLTGGRTPVIRAYVMIGVFIGGELLLRSSNPWNSLGMAGCILGVFYPAEVFEVGFYLSFGAVSGIFLIYPLLEQRFLVMSPPLQGVWKLLLVSLSAYLATAPIIAHHFYVFTPLGVLASVFLFPLIFLCLGLGFFYLLLYWTVPPLAMALLPLLKGLGWFLISANGLLTKTGFFFSVVPPSMADLLLYYFFLLILCLYPRGVDFFFWKKTTFKKRSASPSSPKGNFFGGKGFSAVLIGGLMAFKVFSLFPSNYWKITFLDMGHGLSVVSRMSQGGWIVYDGGSYRESHCGRNIIIPYLRSQGAWKVDLLVISHSHRDHLNGLSSLLDEFFVGRVLVPPGFDRTEEGKILMEKILRRKIPLQPVTDGASFHWKGGGSLEILAPPVLSSRAYKIGTNNRSLVVKLSWKGRSVFLTGDMEGWETAYLLGKKNLSADILLLPHHGRKNPLHRELVRKAHPLFGIHSGGQPLLPSIRGIYEGKGVEILSTFERGALEMELKESGWEWKGYKGN